MRGNTGRTTAKEPRTWLLRGRAGDRQSVQSFTLGALAGILLVAMTWMTLATVFHDPQAADERVSDRGLTNQDAQTDHRTPENAGAQPGRSPAAATTTPGATALQRCAREATALSVPVRAAGPALDQWEVHVGAMNQLVVGAITLQQAKAFWSQTRVGAHRLIAAFHAADRATPTRGAGCPVHAPGRAGSPSLRSCVRQVDADARAVRAARAAVSTWEMHVANMEALRSGRLSPAAATQMWLTMWKQGVRELRTFRLAVRAAHLETGCSTG